MSTDNFGKTLQAALCVCVCMLVNVQCVYVCVQVCECGVWKTTLGIYFP